MTKEEKEFHHHVECLKIVPIFNHLNDEELDLIARKAVAKTYNKGEYIYRATDETEALFVIHTGSVRVFRIVESGREQIVRILNPGDFMGEWVVFSGETSQKEYAQAMKKSTICIIYQDDLQDFLANYPEIANRLLQAMARRLSQSDQQTTTLSTEQVDKRLADYLVNLVETDEEEDIVVDLLYSRKDIASYLGTTPETISRKFKELEEAGLIEQLSLKKIKIHNLDDLVFYK